MRLGQTRDLEAMGLLTQVKRGEDARQARRTAGAQQYSAQIQYPTTK